jgi:predicted nucleotidyltransferase
MPLVDDQTRKQIVARVLTARQRRAEFLTQMKARQQEGWQAAHQAAQVLKQEFGAQRVVLFGSMLAPERLTWHSDIDLAFWGIAPENYLQAGVAAEKGHNFPTDWHRQLLEQVSLEISTVRQAVLSEQTSVELDEFRRFRHVVRSNYAYNLKPEMVIRLSEKLLSCCQGLTQDIQKFLSTYSS